MYERIQYSEFNLFFLPLFLLIIYKHSFMSKIQIGILFILFCFSTQFVKSQSIKKKIWLPKRNLFETVIWDPLSGHTGGSLNAYWEEGAFNEKVYATFIIGMQRSFFRVEYESGLSWDIGLDLGVFTQFEFKDNRQNILNSDFKIGMPITLMKDHWALRVNMFHLSSHFGDDYIFRNDIEDYTPESLTYEQADFSYYYYHKQSKYYVGFGFVFRSNTDRKRWSFHVGFDGSQIINKAKTIAFLWGAHLNLDEQTDFKIGIKPGIGLQFGKEEQKPLKLILEFYTGPTPYGAYEFRTITQLGLGLYYSPF